MDSSIWLTEDRQIYIHWRNHLFDVNRTASSDERDHREPNTALNVRAHGRPNSSLHSFAKILDGYRPIGLALKLILLREVERWNDANSPMVG
jgi:hypothetical protein